jgi:tripartite-type tricarboxylate transporter receptor subunit TctC
MKVHASTKLVFLGLAVAFSLILASGAVAQPGEFVKGVLQPLADGFPKGPITLVAVDDPGSRDSIYTRHMQDALRGISPVPIKTSDEPVANVGTFDKLREMASRDGGKEGYFVVSVDPFGNATDLLTSPISKDLGVDINDLNMVIVTDRLTRVVIQKKGVPWGPTFVGMVEYVKKNPGKVIYSAPGVGSGSDIGMTYMLQKAGIADKVKKVPGANTKESNTIVAAGMADFGYARMDTFMPHWEAKKIDATMFTSPVPPPWNKDKNIITAEQYGLDRNMGDILLGYAVPKEVPKSHVEWLYKLLKAGASTASYKKRESLFPGTAIGPFLDPAQSMKLVKDILVSSEPIIRAMGLHWEQQK